MRRSGRASGRSSTFLLTTTEHYRRQADKDIEILEQWIQAYPRDTIPRDNLALQEKRVGQPEKAVASASEALRLNPKDPYAYQNGGRLYLALNRYDEAKAVAEQGHRTKAEPWSIHITLYEVAFIRGDEGAMQREVEQAAGKVQEPVIGLMRAVGECALGKIKRCEGELCPCVSVAQAQGRKSMRRRFWGPRQAAMPGQASPGSSPDDECGARAFREHYFASGAARSFARIGDTAQSEKLAEGLSKEFPYATVLNQVLLPTARALNSLQRNQPDQAVAALEPAKPYEFGSGNGLGPSTSAAKLFCACTMEPRRRRSIREFSTIAGLIRWAGVIPWLIWDWGALMLCRATREKLKRLTRISLRFGKMRTRMFRY
jgi:tetratricopeptide (TPR) repeat protein